jgi:hypothetical protein
MQQIANNPNALRALTGGGFGVRRPQSPLLYIERLSATTYESGSCGYRTPNRSFATFARFFFEPLSL